MSHSAQDILDTILNRLKTLANTETIVGDPITVGDITILPVIKLSVGFAAGGGEGGNTKDDKVKGMGGGGGGGATVTPVGFIIWDGEKVTFNAIGKGKLDSLVETVPDLLRKFGFNAKKDGKSRSGKDEKKKHSDEDNS